MPETIQQIQFPKQENVSFLIMKKEITNRALF